MHAALQPPGPEHQVGDALARLARSAATLHKMPCQTKPLPVADAYQEADHALGRLPDVGYC